MVTRIGPWWMALVVASFFASAAQGADRSPASTEALKRRTPTAVTPVSKPGRAEPRKATQPPVRKTPAEAPAGKVLAPKRPGKSTGPSQGSTAPGAGHRQSPIGGMTEPSCGDRFGVDSIQASPPLDPGEEVWIHGCGFGTNPPGGEVRLLGDFPGGYLKLQIAGWRNHRIAARMPKVGGVPDMPAARLQIVRRDGKTSSWVDVGGFRASRERRTIHPRAVNPQCATVSNKDDCKLAASHPLAESSFYGNSSFAARHRVTTPFNCDSAVNRLGKWTERTDRAHVSLANGWKITGSSWWWTKLEGDSKVSAPTGIQKGASSANVQIDWGLFTVKCGGPLVSDVRYKLEIYAEGPKGIPHY